LGGATRDLFERGPAIIRKVVERPCLHRVNY
jgi:hypothetical protein